MRTAEVGVFVGEGGPVLDGEDCGGGDGSVSVVVEDGVGSGSAGVLVEVRIHDFRSEDGSDAKKIDLRPR